ncbi:transporter substrate-binding domain-containing protein [Psychromonas sp. PT13]|uniref:transporter substrate-binding domain-containing protein n=1 Tax=Psychromonas sp. PT13 TaxID=3439547 RepID=UPI003EB998B9
MKKALLVISMVLTSLSTQAADIIKIGVAAEPYPPFSSKSADGTWQGFEIDLIHDVCERAQLNCEIKDIAWDGIIPSLQGHKIDVIFNSMSATAERAKKVLFTNPYYNTLPAVVGLEGQKFAFDKATLKGKIIGVQNSTIAAIYIKEKAGKLATIRYYDTQDAVNSDLLAGRIDFMLSDDISAVHFYKNNKAGLEYYGPVTYEESLGKGVAAAVRLDETALAAKLNTAIDALVVSEKYNDLSMKYFGTNIAP